MSASTLHKSAAELLRSWQPAERHALALQHTMLAFLDAQPQACLRANVAGHITASAFVFSHDHSHILLTLHPRVGRWLQLGGHCEESDDTVIDAALREATEESGIAGLRIEPELYDAETHPITCSLGQPTRHLDLRFRVTAPAGAVAVRSAESDDLRWWPIDSLPPDCGVSRETVLH